MRSPLRWLRTIVWRQRTSCEKPDLPLMRITAAQYGTTLRGLCLLALDCPAAEHLPTGELFVQSVIGSAKPNTPLEQEIARQLRKAAANPEGTIYALGERSPEGRAAVWAVTSRDGTWAVAVRWRDLAHLETPPAPGSEEQG